MILLLTFTSVRSFVQISGVVLCICYFVYYFLYYYFVIILCHVFCLSFCWFIPLCSLFSVSFIFKSLHFLCKQLFQLAHFQIFWQPEWIEYLEYLFVALFPLFVMKNESKMYPFCIDLKCFVLFCEHYDSKLLQFRNIRLGKIWPFCVQNISLPEWGAILLAVIMITESSHNIQQIKTLIQQKLSLCEIPRSF